jgi:hypothetical protein
MYTGTNTLVSRLTFEILLELFCFVLSWLFLWNMRGTKLNCGGYCRYLDDLLIIDPSEMDN